MEELSRKPFIPRIPNDMSQEDLESSIRDLSGLDSFRLKVIDRQGESGDSFKFGFLELRDAEESRFFLGKGLQLEDGRYINFRVSSQSVGK